MNEVKAKTGRGPADRRVLWVVGVAVAAFAVGGLTGAVDSTWAMPDAVTGNVGHTLTANATSAFVRVDAGVAPLAVAGLTETERERLATASEGNGEFMVNADYITYTTYNAPGGMLQNVSNNEGEQIGFNIEPGFGQPFPFFNFDEESAWYADDSLYVNTYLTPTMPLVLELVANNRATLDLSALQLTRLDVQTGIEPVEVDLPPGAYPAHIDGNVGTLEVNVPASPQAIDLTVEGDLGATRVEVAEGARLNTAISGNVGQTTVVLGRGVVGTLAIEGDVGSTVLRVPRDLPLRLSVTSDEGSIRIPEELQQVNGTRSGSQAVYESATYATYADAETVLDINYEGDVGSFTVQLTEPTTE